MKYLEWALAGLMLGGMALSLMMVEGGSLVFVISGTLLSLFYLTLGFPIFYGVSLRDLLGGRLKSLDNIRVIGSVLLGVVFSVLTMGIVFKFMGWNGADPMLLAGLIGLLPAVLVGIRFVGADERGFHRRILYRAGLIIVFALIFLLR